MQENIETQSNVESQQNQQSNVQHVDSKNFEKLRLLDEDRMSLDLARANKRNAQLQAEKAIAQNETADLAYKYLILQIYMKYGLNENDALTESGDILKNAALKK